MGAENALALVAILWLAPTDSGSNFQLKEVVCSCIIPENTHQKTSLKRGFFKSSLCKIYFTDSINLAKIFGSVTAI
jgi:hypothetical protein